MPSDPREDLIDRIYEAAVVPEQWLKVLDGLSAIADGDGALIISQNAFQQRWLGTGAAETVFRLGVEQGWQGERNPRAPRFFAAQYAGFLNDFDLLTQDEVDHHPYYTEYLRPNGMGWGTATAIQVPTGDVIGFDVECRFERGPVERATLRRLDKLRPHLARASLISSRLMFERVRTMAETLGIIGLPAVVLHGSGRPLAMNGLFEALMPERVSENRSRLVLTDLSADKLFVEALGRLGRMGDQDSVRSIPVAAQDERPSIILHLLPVRRAAHDVFSGGASVLVVTPVEPRKVPNAKVLQGLFDLTPSEARVARAVGEGATVAQIAMAHDLSVETVRSQLKSALSKSGLGRQIDLARLLSGMVLPLN